MATIDKALLQRLREVTGLGLMACREALEKSNNDFDKAISILREEGALKAGKRLDKIASEGLIHAYIHPGSKLGVLVEINCETDFVARTTDIEQFAADIALQVAAMKPIYLAPSDVDPKILEVERAKVVEEMGDKKKPEAVMNQIIEGKFGRIYSELCLLKQKFIRNEDITVEAALQQIAAKTGENVRIKRFARFELGVE